MHPTHVTSRHAASCTLQARSSAGPAAGGHSSGAWSYNFGICMAMHSLVSADGQPFDGEILVGPNNTNQLVGEDAHHTDLATKQRQGRRGRSVRKHD